MHQGWMSRIQAKNVFSHCFGTNDAAPVSTAAIAGLASSPALQYHCTVSSGSIGTPERSPCGTWCVCGSIRSSSPSRSSSATIADRASARSRPSRPRRKAGSATPVDRRDGVRDLGERHPRRAVEHRWHRQAMALADAEIVEVVRGRDLDRAGALLRIGIRVGNDRDAPPDQRQDRLPPDQIGDSADRRDARRRRYRRAWSPAGSSRP